MIRVLSALMFLVPTVLVAQATTSIRGVVYNMAEEPIAGVEVLLAGQDRRVYTNARGQFLFDGLRPRIYSLVVRHPGYAAARAQVPAEDTTAVEVDVYLRMLPQILENIVVTGTRRGLHGTVSDAGVRPVSGARVTLLGGAGSTLTDTTGRFSFLDVKAGGYVVMATAPGLVARPLHVQVPGARSLEVVIHMAEAPIGWREPAGQRAALTELGRRLAFNPSRTRMMRDELERFAGRQLCDIARIRSVFRSEEATVIVDGVEVLHQWSLCHWNTDELELVEWGVNPCQDATGTIAGLLGVYCTSRRTPNLYTAPGRRPGGFIAVWTRQ